MIVCMLLKIDSPPALSNLPIASTNRVSLARAMTRRQRQAEAAVPSED